MTKLSDTQSILLTAAALRADGNLLPLPGSLRGGRGQGGRRAVTRGLAEEQTVESAATADRALNRLWRNADDGRGVVLRITAAGLDALEIEAGSAAVAAVEAGVAPPADKGAAAALAGLWAPQRPVRARPEGTKQAMLVGLLGRAEGATIAFAGALEKRLGLTIESEKVDGRGRVYRIAD